MNKSHRENQIDIAQKILDAMRTINVNDIAVDFYISLRQYHINIPSTINIVDEDLNKVSIYIFKYTNIDEIVQDLVTKDFIELEEKYSRTWR